MTLSVRDYQLFVINMHTRMPFRYGIAELKALPHLIVRLDLEIDGRAGHGVAAEGLVPKWFSKQPAETYAQEIAAMVEVVTHAADTIRGASAESPFALWHELYQAQSRWAADTLHPPLLWNFGVSLVERALIDAYCRITGQTFAGAVRDGTLGIDLGTIHPKLEGTDVRCLLPPARRHLIVRHTVGLSDPLGDSQIASEDRVVDGLPQSLQEAIATYGLTHFKIKLCGEVERDLSRLRQLADMLLDIGEPLRFTLDGNEQFRDVESLRELWSRLNTSTLSPFMKHLLFIEQPFHRAAALSDGVARDLKRWNNRPSIIIDESDAELGSLHRALECGYAGTTHKNCKGIFKSIASAVLLEQKRRMHREVTFFHSAEDLSTVGPIALLQDIAVVATLGIEDVERNGHHYFRGLSMWPQDVQASALQNHGDIYRKHLDGFATLAVTSGQIDVGSVVDSPFGIGFDLDLNRLTRMSQWQYSSLALS